MQIEFYDKRYQEGYMEAWDKGKIAKVRELLRSLVLPSSGKALDFGCGNGVFTAILKEELPDWDVYGTDISDTALSNARERHPSCSFFSLPNASEYSGFFQLVFSHHVIEHVDHLEQMADQFNLLSADHSTHFHVLPCGNPGSLEHSIAVSVQNGIDKDQGNRFFFEEPGHVRRLTSNDLNNLMKDLGFQLADARYSNQFWGAVNWITKSSPRFVRRLTDQRMVLDQKSGQRLRNLRQWLLPLTYAQHALVLFLLYQNRYRRRAGETLRMYLLALPALCSLPLYAWLNRKADKEWQKKQRDPNGSEMFLIFTR